MPEASFDWSAEESDDETVTLKGPRLSATVSANGAIAFERDGKALLESKERSFHQNDFPRDEDKEGVEEVFSFETTKRCMD